MTTLANRTNTALVVINVQDGAVAEAHERNRVVANIVQQLGREPEILSPTIPHHDSEHRSSSGTIPEQGPSSLANGAALFQRVQPSGSPKRLIDCTGSGSSASRLASLVVELGLGRVSKQMHGRPLMGLIASLLACSYP